MDIRTLHWSLLDSKKSSATDDGFSRALAVWINKPHVVNRRLCGTQIIHSSASECRYDSQDFSLFLNNILMKHGNVSCNIKTEENHENDTSSSTDHHDSSCADLSLDIDNLDAVDKDLTVVVIRDLHPKQIDRYPVLREVIVYDKSQQTIIFYPLCARTSESGKPDNCSLNDDNSSYRFSYQKGSIFLEYCSQNVKDSSDVPQKSQCHVTPDWLKERLLTKLCRWSEEVKLKTGVTSLKLVPLDKYTTKYHLLKKKYGRELVKIWPERTDPLKYVYEDIAIATYLLLVWRKERESLGLTEMQSFVDLGCGNGLLVYILTKEGHTGLGIDVRRRKIWDMFCSDINLMEKSITPSSNSLFPEYDWLIGNHSDELTPWIPVMAARSSYRTRYFVLPCCHHDFDRKFSMNRSGVSQYRTYLDFVSEIGQVCGFEVEEDVLRIPSTKRVCFIGKKRMYPEHEEAEIDEKRQEYIEKRCKKSAQCIKLCPFTEEPSDFREAGVDYTDPGDREPVMKKVRVEHRISTPFVDAISGPGAKKEDSWAPNFESRASQEKVRNCTEVDSYTKETIVRTVFNKVLQAEHSDVRILEDGRTWHKGGSISLPTVASYFDGDLLKKLKNECGGLQTLLRNHHSIFEVSKGCVKLRDLSSSMSSLPACIKKKTKKKKRPKSDISLYLKTSLCWFHDNHPDGCPCLSESCTFAHGQSELKDSPRIHGAGGKR